MNRIISQVFSRIEMMNDKPTITILVPCYNEEKTIRKCVHSWLDQTHPADEIIIVNDCSTDNSLEILQEFEDRVTIIDLPQNTGNKSFVQEEGLKHVKTDIFVATDADTIMDKDFVKRVQLAFRDKNVQAFAGYVKSLKCNWLTACREIDYIVGQDLHKAAQYEIKFLLVIPGCAGAFRTDMFRKNIMFDHDTLTEDMDFTYKINKLGLNIFYDPEAIVYTQDPNNLKSYINQMRRWYSGGWQNLMKHIGIVKSPIKAMELSILYMDGLIFYPLLFITPILSLRAFIYLLAHCFALGLVFGLYSAIKRRRIDLLLFSPLFVPIAYLHAYIFIEQFIREVIFKKKNLVWFHPERREVT
jgi:cellulose synthase/poly-beta-1,6-N-acetylglucosamine synthase-like glycosyltransferase